jgi:hypothetical protein
MSNLPRAKALETALASMDPGTPPLEAARILRRDFPSEVARQGAQLLELRRRARGRMPNAERLVLTRIGLEQATGQAVARARATRIADRFADAPVLDATVGVGGDALALAQRGLRLVCADTDAVHAQCAAENLRRAGFAARVVQADALHPPVRPSTALLVLDPDRRVAGVRSLDPERWSPRLSQGIELARSFRGACLKLAPALDIARVRVPDDLPHAWQWTSLDGSLSEVALWTGELARDAPEREVLALRSDGRLHRYGGARAEAAHLSAADATRVGWIFEPDPALIRSGLLGRYANELGLRPLGPDIAFLGAATRTDGELLRSWRVLAHSSVDRKRVRAMLREHDVGPITVKKRGHPKSAAELERSLRGPGSRRATVLVARLERGHHAYLVEACAG